MKLPWRKVLWIYRSASGGWLVSIFKRQWYVRIERVPEPELSELLINSLNDILGEQPNAFANNALMSRLARKAGPK